MVDNREAGRTVRRRHPLLFGADVVCRLGLAAVPAWHLAGRPSGVWGLVLILVCGVGLLLSSALLRRAATEAGYVRTGDGPACRQLRGYIRTHHPVLYGAEIICWMGVAGAGVWQLSTHARSGWAPGLFAVSLAGVFVCFVLMVRRDPEDRL